MIFNYDEPKIPAENRKTEGKINPKSLVYS